MNTSQPVRAVAYYRKSNDDTGELGESIRQQRQWAEEATTKENVVIVKEFEDQSVSGLETKKRSGFMQMLAFCEEQARLGTPIETIVCYHTNRFSRADSFKTSRYVDEFRDAGVCRMLTASKWIDLYSSEARIIFNVEQEAGAHRFSVDLVAVTRRGKREVIDKGNWCGGKPPFGYTVDPNTRTVGKGRINPKLLSGKLMIDPEEAEHVRFIFNEYASGTKGLRGIAEALTERGVCAPTGGKWTVSTISGILRNTVYLGHITHGRRSSSKLLGSVRVPVKKTETASGAQENVLTTRGAHDPIILQPLFDGVQARLASNRKKTSPNKSFMLSGLLKCGHCGGPMCGRTYNQAAAPHFYVCSRYNGLGAKLSGCTLNAIPEDKLLAAVAKKLAAAYFNAESLKKVRDSLRAREQGEHSATPERTLTARIANLDRQIEKNSKRLMDLDDAIFEEFSEQLLKLKEERNTLTTQLEAVRAKTVVTEDLDARVERILKRAEQFAHALKYGNPDEARTTLREMIDHVELWFHVGNNGSRKRTKFAKAMIYLHANSVLSTSTDLSGNLRPAAPRAAGRGSSLSRPS